LDSRLTIDVTATQEEIAVRIDDRRPRSLTLFGELSVEQRHQLATDAWTVGLRALANAYAQAEEARLQDIGKTLVDDIDRQLKAHIAGQQQTIATVLGKYFDPADGQVTPRLAAFVDDHGVLAHLLEKFLAPQNSVLAQTLASAGRRVEPALQKAQPD
jgi:hypothetical protein